MTRRPSARLVAAMTLAILLVGCARQANPADGPPDLAELARNSPEFVAAVSEQYETGKTPGQEVFNRKCSICHADAPTMPGTVALGTRYEGTEPGALEKRTDLTPEMVRYFVRNGISIMPGFRKTEIPDQELDQLVTYLVKKK